MGLNLLTIVDSSTTYMYTPSLWILFGHYMQIFMCWWITIIFFIIVNIKMKCVYNYCLQRNCVLLCVDSGSVNLQPIDTN